MDESKKLDGLENRFVVKPNPKWHVWDSKNGVVLDNRYFVFREEAESYRRREIRLNS